MPTTTITRRQFKSRMATKQDVWRAIPALMGNGNGTIQVPNQENMVYIRVGDGDLGQAFNNRCPLRDNLAIYVGYDPITDPDRRIFQVLSVRMADYASAGNVTVPNVGPHNTTHYYGGGDDVYIEWRRLMGLRVGRPVAFVVTVDPGIFYSAGAWTEIPSTTVNLTATHAALVGVQAQYVLISLSPTGVVTATAGTVIASIALLTMADCPTPPAGHIPLAAVRLYKMQTAIGDTPGAPDIVDLRFPTYNTASAYVTPHDVLSASHGDALAGAVVDGDTIIGNVTPKWSRLAIAIPAANVRNVLGVDNGELRPSWKTTLDATNPTTIGIGDVASPGTSLIYSHRDHQHASPSTWTATAHAIDGAIHTAAGRTAGQVLIATGAAAFGWSSFLFAGTPGGMLNISVPITKILTLTTFDDVEVQITGIHHLLGGGAGSYLTLPNASTEITGGGTLALGGYTLTVPATGTAALGTGTATRLAAWSGTNTLVAGTVVQPATNVLTLLNSAASTLSLAITAAKTLTLTATDDFNLTVPATGTAALLGTANVFTAVQTVNLNTATLQAPLTGTVLHLGNADSANSYFTLDGYGSGIGIGFIGRRSMGTAASPTAIDAARTLFLIDAYGYDGSAYGRGAYIGFETIGAFNGTTHSTNINFYTVSGTTLTSQLIVASAGGLIVGAATGGAKGAGTINAAADIYKNNSAYTNPDYALEQWATGSVKQFADRPGATDYRRMTLGEIEAHIKEHLRLPRMSDEPSGIFERADMVLEKLEELYTHVIELSHRLEELEVARG